MIAYTTVGTNDLPRALEFYDALFAEVGAGRVYNSERLVGYAPNAKESMFGVCAPYDGQPATIGNGTMIAVGFPDKESVHRFYDKAIELGAQCEGAAGPRGEGGSYCAYFRDLDGNKINAFAMVPPEK